MAGKTMIASVCEHEKIEMLSQGWIEIPNWLKPTIEEMRKSGIIRLLVVITPSCKVNHGSSNPTGGENAEKNP